ncbi:MAG: radical SAM protein [Candidatus Coatesbacteria bacterium]|nr:radical SAM protein [Candidatus Coatesbacteria bacterium]
MLDNPHLIDWAITNRCNLKCVHCRGMAQEELDSETLLSVAEEIPALNPGWVILEGGEALLRDELWDIIDILHRRGIRLYLISNGMLLNRMSVERLAESAVRLMISIDGADRGSYESTRIGASFSRLRESVALAGEFGILDSCPVTIGKHNLHEVSNIFRFVKELGYSKITILGLKPCQNYSEYALTGAQYRELFKELIGLRESVGMDMYVDEPFFKPFLLEEGISFEREAEDGILVPDLSRCVFGEYIFIETDGAVRPCTFAPVSMGSVKGSTLTALWKEMQDSQLVSEVRDRERRSGACRICRHIDDCGGCRSRAFALTGSWTASDPSCPLKGNTN